AELVALEAAAPEATTGTTLLHADLRADNILLTPSRVFFIDWPWASLGASWVDLLFMLPSVAMQGGPKPWQIFDDHPLGRRAPATQASPPGLAVPPAPLRVGHRARRRTRHRRAARHRAPTRTSLPWPAAAARVRRQATAASAGRRSRPRPVATRSPLRPSR